MLNGQKTYIVAAVMLAMGLIDVSWHDLANINGEQLILEALAFAGLRRGIG